MQTCPYNEDPITPNFYKGKLGLTRVYILAHVSLRLTRCAYRMGLELACVRPCVRPSVRPLTLSNMNISETSWSIVIKFYLKHHWGAGKAALGFGPYQIGTLVSMATDSSHRVTMEKTL